MENEYFSYFQLVLVNFVEHVVQVRLRVHLEPFCVVAPFGDQRSELRPLVLLDHAQVVASFDVHLRFVFQNGVQRLAHLVGAVDGEHGDVEEVGVLLLGVEPLQVVRQKVDLDVGPLEPSQQSPRAFILLCHSVFTLVNVQQINFLGSFLQPFEFLLVRG